MRCVPASICAVALLAACSGAAAQGLRISDRLVAPPALEAPTPIPEETLAGRLTLADAVRRALMRNANVLVQAQQVRIGEGGVQQARGAYDTDIVGRAERSRTVRPLGAGDRAGLPRDMDEEWAWSTAYRVGIERNLESGIHLETGMNVTSTFSNTTNFAGTPRQTAGALNFSLRVPLQRNFGGVQQASALRSAEFERGAAVEDLLQTGASSVLAAVQAYWDIAARQERLSVLRASEARAGELVGELRKLIAADQIPAAELNLALASDAEKRSARIAEEQALVQAWTTLGRALQADTADPMGNSGGSTDTLPAIPADLAPTGLLAEEPVTATVERRADVRAARLRERASFEQLLAANDGLRPQVDLLFGATSNTLAEGASSLSIGSALDQRRANPSLNVAVEIRWPWAHDTARGQVLTRSATHDQNVIRLRDLERSVGPAVASTRAALRRIASRTADAQQAVERFSVSVRNELTKRRLGLSTLIDVISVQDRLDNAQLGLIQLRQEYAATLAQLLFETGQLVVDANGSFSVDIGRLAGATR